MSIFIHFLNQFHPSPAYPGNFQGFMQSLAYRFFIDWQL